VVDVVHRYDNLRCEGQTSAEVQMWSLQQVNHQTMYFSFRLPSEIVPTRSVKVMLKLSNVAEA